jgi:lysyl-tRNA synthetase, class II
MSNAEPSLSEQQEIRLEKLDKLRELKVNPYPYGYDVTHYSEEILRNEDEYLTDTPDENREMQSGYL